MSPAFVDSLYPLVLSADVTGARTLLASLDGPELKEAQKWFGRSVRWLDSIPFEAFGSDRAQLYNWSEAKWIHDLCAVRLCGPATAARRVRWGDHWSYREDVGELALIDALNGRDRDWVTSFVEEASRARLGGNARSGEVLSRVLRTVGRHHELPCPTGSTFYEYWLAGCPEDTIEDCLASDPWMPDLLDNYLASGGSSGDLPQAISALLERRLIDRTRLLRHVLSLLTSPGRPGSQQTLAKVLTVLAPAPAEINGGLDYLLGVMSTSVGAVGRVLLPLALPLLTDGDDLTQLTAVIASRSEKDQKKRLLNALKGFPDRFGTEPVLASLEALAADDDAAFAAQARTFAEKLRRTSDHPEVPAAPSEASPRIGLWELSPSRQPVPTRREGPFTFEWTVDWTNFLTASGRAKPIDQTSVVNELLTVLSEGRAAEVDRFFELAGRLLSGGTLVLSRITNLLPDMFMAGALRAVWSQALVLADTCANRADTPPTLADLLRTLTRFASEVPFYELPAGSLNLAARKGGTKAQVEARVLGAALARTTTQEFLERLSTMPQSPAPIGYGAGSEE